MNILSLKLFKLLRLRISKIKAMLKAQDDAKKDLPQDWDGVDLNAYTLVNRAPGARKCDLLTRAHMASRHLDQAKIYQKTGRARWHHNTNEQQYSSREIKLDPQLEFMSDELGLSKTSDKTVIGPSNRAT